MDRFACVNLDQFPLQLLLGRRPQWRALPAAVVDRETAQGVVLWVNDHSRALRILPGMRFASALSLSRHLRAGVVPESEILANVAALSDRLRFYTSDVEPSQHEPGVFWLGASGLSLLYPSLSEWARLIHDELTRVGYRAAVVVGFSRFGTYAAAKTRDGVIVFESPESETEAASRVPIDRLGFDPNLRDSLARLGVTTLGAFLDLPAAGVRKRFGGDIHRLHELARGELFAPLQPDHPTEPVTGAIVLDYPETHVERLMVVVAHLLDPMLAVLSGRDELVAALVMNFVFDDGGKRSECIEPASPTLEPELITDLARLRLEGMTLSSGIVEIELEAKSVSASRRQRDLFERQSPRDIEAANRAIARLRAELGEHAVKRARLCEGHLPEACFEWEPVRKITQPSPRSVATRPLVRRIYRRPVALTRRRQQEPKSALVTLYEDRLIEESIGPYVVTGGWWVREVGRDYYFIRTETGRWLWLYYDRRRKCWFLHGEVE